MKNRFNIAEYLQGYTYSQSLSADSLTSSVASTSSIPIDFNIDYSVFENHIFFGNSLKRVISNLNYVIDTYPIGLSGSQTATLSAYEVSQVENWNRTTSMFQQHIVEFLCGATGGNTTPTVTSSATSFLGEVVTLNILNRDSSNNVYDPRAIWNMGILLSTASAYDEGITTLKYTSGTGSDFFNIASYWGDEKTKVIPSEINVSVNRAMDYMRTFPEVYTEGDDRDVFNNFLQIWGEFYDLIKVYIDQFPNLFSPDYSGFNRTPEGIVQYYVARQFGVELFEGAILGELPQYYQKLGRRGLQKITYEIWNRVLCDLTDLLKAKGSKAGFNKLVNDYGIYNGWITTKEYVDLLETTENTYEIDRTVKLPVLDTQDKIVMTFAPSVAYEDFTLLFQNTIPDLADSTEPQIIFYLEGNVSGFTQFVFYCDNINEQYKLDVVDYATLLITNLVTISGSDFYALRDYHTNSLIPFALRQDFSNMNYAYFDTCLSSYTIDYTSGLPRLVFVDTCIFQFGGSATLTGAVSYNGMAGVFANIKLFQDLKPSVSSYMINPHSRYEETEMLFDYKLYESPTGSLLNSYIGPLTSTITSANINFVSTPQYDLFPLNFQRRFSTHGTNIPGGDFINFATDSKRRGSNFGYGVFSAEAVNNDILDYYGSSTATNVSSFYVDPAYYYEDYEDKYHWKNLVNHRANVISRGRYPDGVNYTKFIKVIEKYRHILYNFFQTTEQFLRFKSKIIQKGVNIEPIMLDREKHNIDSAEVTIQTLPMAFTAETINAFTPEVFPISLTAHSISSFQQNNYNVSLSSHTENVYKEDTKNISVSAIQSFYASKSDTMNVSISGYQGLNMYFDNPNQDTSCIFLNDLITYEGCNNNDRFYTVNNNNENLNPTSKTSNIIKTVVTSNKQVIETGMFPIKLKGTIPFIIFSNASLTGSGSAVNYNVANGSLLGVDVMGNVSVSTTGTVTGNNYFISTYNNVPLTGSLNTTWYSYLYDTGLVFETRFAISGTFTGVFLKYDFKDMGLDTDANYYRKNLKLNLQQQKDNVFLTNRDAIFEIENPLEKNSKLPLFHFYCYNNSEYYRTSKFRIPSYSVNGTNFLVTINPVFNGINVGKANVGITNLVTKEYMPFVINSVIDTNAYIDTDLTVLGNSNGGNTPQVGYTTEHHTLDANDIINGYINFGGSITGFAINISKGIFVYLNGGLQDTTFFNYSFDGVHNKLLLQNTTSLTAGDIIGTYYTY